MSKPIPRFIPFLVVAAMICPPLTASTQKIYTPEELSRWTLVGVGSVEVDAASKALRLFEEYPEAHVNLGNLLAGVATAGPGPKPGSSHAPCLSPA